MQLQLSYFHRLPHLINKTTCFMGLKKKMAHTDQSNRENKNCSSNSYTPIHCKKGLHDQHRGDRFYYVAWYLAQLEAV